ncbi:Sulfate adenylyltransferase subunit 2 [Granulosicoccus antarcticus IMCC3135]|uniref:Sulfate adenylyltransferase subunit 2 n=2 Tax=Granulosicoccus TaxID=437504 RepID=A0A2Z2NLD4_9GAMM|nr:Sulfate adenylyltransferase subunit 2 [Granulosicoccus antarcticus IMCC3135]
MSKQPSSRQSVSELNALRHRAVQQRLDGRTLAETQSIVGLSAPTIIAAVKAYQQGGWEAVDVGPRGRPKANTAVMELDKLLQHLLNAATLRPDSNRQAQPLWNSERTRQWLETQSLKISRSTVLSWLSKWSLQPDSRYRRLQNRPGTSHWQTEHERFARKARRRGTPVHWVASRRLAGSRHQLFAHDLRGHAYWSLTATTPKASEYLSFFQALAMEHTTGIALVLPGAHLLRDPLLARWLQDSDTQTLVITEPTDYSSLDNEPLTQQTTTPMTSTSDKKPAASPASKTGSTSNARTLTHLQRLEAESIHIMREVVAEADNPVMLYSVGKDSAVMLHLARKAFFPATPPFPLLHVDTGWKFKAMYDFRDKIVKEYGMELLTHINPEGVAQKVNPFTHGSALHTDIMKTQGLKQALDEHRFDIAFGGARRDEEKSRAKERVFSFRSAQHRWDAKNQRPELWSLYNARKQRDESIRVFPISNWTELDIWQYIHRENIPIVPLYLAGERPVVMRDGAMIMVDDDRMPMKEGEVPEMRSVRFRTLGCYPLTGAVESTATTLEEIIQEMLLTRTSERQGRMIDHDSAASMEKKKQEGYF